MFVLQTFLGDEGESNICRSFLGSSLKHLLLKIWSLLKYLVCMLSGGAFVGSTAYFSI